MWVKLDDDFFDHPKVMAAGTQAAFLYVASLTYAGRQLTDGFIPMRQVAVLAAKVEIACADDAAARLQDVGLWDAAPGGYQIHDWDEYNPSAASVRAQREAHAARQAAYRERRERGATGVYVTSEVTPDGTEHVTTSVTSFDGDASRDVDSDAATDTSPVPGPGPVPDPDLRPDPAADAATRARARNVSSGDAGADVEGVKRARNGRMLPNSIQAEIAERWSSLQGRVVLLNAAQLSEATHLHDQAAEDGRRELFWEAMGDAARGGKPWTWFITAVKGRLLGEDFRRQPASAGYRARAAPATDLRGRYRAVVQSADEMSDEEFERLRAERFGEPSADSAGGEDA